MSKKHKKNKYDLDSDNLDFTRAKGKFEYVDEADIKKMSKKEREKERLRMLKLKDKEVLKQCQCNHIARNTGRCYFKQDENDPTVQICKICGARLLNAQGWADVDDGVIETAALVVRSVVGLVRNKIKMNDETYERFTNALQIIAKMPDLYHAISLEDDDDSDPYEAKKHKKKDKHGKHGKHGKDKKKHKKNKNKDSYGGNYRIEY